MISEERLQQLAAEAERARKKYQPQTVEDLEHIATEEYGAVEVIRTSLAKSEVIKERGSGNIIILYNAFYEPYLPVVLGHEIGHIAASHLNTSKRNLSPSQRMMQEQEADYYSACLNEISLETLQCFRDRDWLYAFSGRLRRLFQPEQVRSEVERLQRLGVYHWLE